MLLVVEVVNAHNLVPKDGEGSASPFVEVDFANQRSRTRTVHKNLNPFWNQKLVFDLDESNTRIHQSIEVCVYNERRPLPGRNFLGRVRIPGTSIAREGEEAYQRFRLEKKWFSSFVRGEIGVKVYTSHNSALKYTPRPSSPCAPPQAQLHTSSPTPNPLTKSISEHTHLIHTISSIDVAPPTPANSFIPNTPKVITTDPKEDISEPAETDQSFFPAEEQKEEIKETVKLETEATQGQHNIYKHQALKQPDLSANKQPLGVPLAMNRGDSPRLHPVNPHEDFSLKATSPQLGELWPKGGGAFSGRGWMGSERLTSTYDLVEQVFYLFVRVVKAKDLPPNPLTGSCGPYVEVRLGNYRGRTQHFDKKLNPEWNQVFAFSKDHIQSSMLEVLVRDKEMVGRDDCVGKVMFDLNEVPTRVPPDSPLAPQWYRLEDLRGHSKAREEIMVAVWMGTQADEAFPEAWHSDSASVYGEGILNIRSKVYVSPKLWYVRINVVEAQDIVPNYRTRPPQLFAKVQVGSQVLKTNICPTPTPNPFWNEDLIFVAAEPFEEQMFVTIEDRIHPTRDQVLGKLALPLNDLEKRLNHRAVQSQWFNLERFGMGEELEDDTRRELKFSSRVHLRVCLEGGYHVLDESTMYASDQRPTARQLWEQPVGILEVGILGAQDLLPMKMKDGRGITDAYCVAKYGQKWVRTRTAINTFNPKWNEQYTWQVYDPCTIITLGVFDNGHLASRSSSASAARDSRIGKVRIRLSTLEAHRIYTLSYPLLVLHPPGLKKMGELQLAIRFTSLSLSHMIYIYGHPLLPKMHYLHPLTVNQVDNLRHQAMNIVSVRLSRAEPPLRKEVVEYMLDVDSHLWSMRRSKANFFRIMSLLSGLMSVSRSFEDVCYWKSPVTSVLVHVLFLILVWYPELMLPTLFLYMFLIGMWNYRHRPRHPPHMDIKLSWAEAVHPDELDEEFDTFPTSRPQDVVRMRYDRLRSVAGRIQTIVGDIATQGERFQSLLSWRDPRATSLFISFCFCAAVVLYVTPFRAVSLITGLYMLRHPRFRSKLPSVPSSFFKRLPARTDSLL